MHVYLIGLLEEVRPVERKDKKSGEMKPLIDVTITFSSKDNEGYLVKSTETLSYPVEMKLKFDPLKGKFIAVPHVFITTSNGNYLFPDEKMQFFTFDKDPLLQPPASK
ncbi:MULTISPECIES: hypothetical protein [unclassified Sulfurospirillum]|uniref:hypothetical protein n=1 Tax=unclassified Sulfurospirillum TaxID=2618290 RepID=UPI000502A323|nr:MULTISPECIES: hypothetical protein [unclassified Sulfurospirillum]KFL34349.1 hypothetical protein JU57_06195 [Sulfurospirillum sp. SCADC]